MATFEVDEVLEATRGTLIVRGERRAGRFRPQTDSRKMKKGDLFLALKGEKFDGHEFVRTACARGAGGVVVEQARALEILSRVRRAGNAPVWVVGVPDT